MIYKSEYSKPIADEVSCRQAGELPDLQIDAWTASSLLQKAIRRGETKLAEQAALRYGRLRGQGIWRRLVLIAFEDVGLGSPAAIIRTATTAQAMLTAALRREYDPQVVARIIVRDLAAAPKDRSTDYLISVAIHDPALGWFRDECTRQSVGDRIASATAGDLPLH